VLSFLYSFLNIHGDVKNVKINLHIYAAYRYLEIFSNLMAETKDSEMSQICIVSVKFLKDVRDFDRNAANWQ
jgi:hypothetical protein